MNDDIKQGLESLGDKSIEELDSLTASCFTEFDNTDDEDKQRELLAAARTFTDRKKALVADGGDSGDSGDGAPDDSGDDGPGEPDDGSASTDTSEAAEGSEAGTDTSEAEPADAEPAPEVTTASGETSTESAEGEQAAVTEPASDPAATDSDGDGSTTSESTTTSEEATVPASTATTDANPVTASADEAIEVADDNKPITAASVPQSAVVAGMDVQGISAGSQFKNLDDVARAFTTRIRTVGRASGSDGEKHTVATVTASYPDERTLDGNAENNAAKIQAVLDSRGQQASDTQSEAVTASGAEDQSALTASGGFCAPLPVRYDIFGVGVTNRPVRDALMMFNATRGGVRFVAPPVLSDLTDAVGLWTSTTDGEPGTATKAELKVTCASEQDAEIDAVTLQLEFGNFMSRAYPELVNRNNELGMIQHARFAEQELLSKMSALSTEATAASKLGIGIDFLNSVARAGSAYRNRHRMPRNTPLRVIAPDYVLDAMRTDLSQRVAGDDKIAVADAMITQFLNRQNVRVTWHLDGTFGAQSDSSPLVDYPSTFDWYLFAEGSFLFLDGGTLDIGIVRDSTLVGTNDYKTFFETFEGVAMVGTEALVVTQELEIMGATVGTIAPSGS